MLRRKLKLSAKTGKVSECESIGSREPAKETKDTIRGKYESNGDKFRFVPDKEFVDFDAYFDKLYETVMEMGLTQKNMNTIFGMFGELVKEYDHLCMKFETNDSQANSSQMERKALSHVQWKLSSIISAKKRLREFKQNPSFVEPTEIALGLKWKTKLSTENDLPDHRMVSTTFHFVPPSKTLQVLLSDPNFEQMFSYYNSSLKHECVDGVYKDFCCGSLHKNKNIFREKDVIQIQIGIDDFEICCAVKSKAVKHKVCGVYFQIRNVPPEIASKIDNIFLVALCNSKDLKNDKKFHDFLKIIVEDLKKLEKEGIRIGTKIYKAVLINISCDNLGANCVFGFAKGFSAEYYCRICELTRKECQQETHELTEKIRSLTS